jgi:hypothetical protein
MSLTPGFAPDAKSQWLELDVELQERILDELENLAAAPLNAPRGIILHDFVHVTRDAHNYIFLRLIVDSNQQSLTLIGVGRYSSPGQ